MPGGFSAECRGCSETFECPPDAAPLSIVKCTLCGVSNKVPVPAQAPAPPSPLASLPATDVQQNLSPEAVSFEEPPPENPVVEAPFLKPTQCPECKLGYQAEDEDLVPRLMICGHSFWY